MTARKHPKTSRDIQHRLMRISNVVATATLASGLAKPALVWANIIKKDENTPTELIQKQVSQVSLTGAADSVTIRQQIEVALSQTNMTIMDAEETIVISAEYTAMILDGLVQALEAYRTDTGELALGVHHLTMGLVIDDTPIDFSMDIEVIDAFNEASVPVQETLEMLNTATSGLPNLNDFPNIQPLSATTINAAFAQDGSEGNGEIATPYQISTPAQLDAMRNELSGHYILMNDIDLSGYANWVPIGTWSGSTSNLTAFSGSLTGALDGEVVHKISGLTLQGASTASYQGLFGMTYDASISNLVISGKISLPTVSTVGLLAGYSTGTTITNVGSEGEITARGSSGGLLGSAQNMTIKDSYSNVNVTTTGGTWTGGFVGVMNTSTIDNCYATGNIIAANFVGGFGGYMQDTQIMNSYASGNVRANSHAGGFVGVLDMSEISHAYALGDVTVTANHIGQSAGGLVGTMQYGVIATNCFATGNIVGSGTSQSGAGIDGYSGGLVGYVSSNYDANYEEKIDTIITNCYATGNVSEAINTGALIGLYSGEHLTVINSYATGIVNGKGYPGDQSSRAGGIVGSDTSGVYVIGSNAVITNSFAISPSITAAQTGAITVGFPTNGDNYRWSELTFNGTTSTINDSASIQGQMKTARELNDIDTFINAGWVFDEDNWYWDDTQKRPLIYGIDHSVQDPHMPEFGMVTKAGMAEQEVPYTGVAYEFAIDDLFDLVQFAKEGDFVYTVNGQPADIVNGKLSFTAAGTYEVVAVPLNVEDTPWGTILPQHTATSVITIVALDEDALENAELSIVHVAGDEHISLEEAKTASAMITGTYVLPEDVVKSSLVITVNGVTYQALLNPDGTWSAEVLMSDLLADADRKVEAVLTITDDDGNTGELADSMSYTIEKKKEDNPSDTDKDKKPATVLPGDKDTDDIQTPKTDTGRKVEEPSSEPDQSVTAADSISERQKLPEAGDVSGLLTGLGAGLTATGGALLAKRRKKGKASNKRKKK